MKMNIFLTFFLILQIYEPVFSQKIEILENPDDVKITELTILNSTFRETNLSISPDGKYLYFMSVRGGMPWSSMYGTYKGKPRYDGDIWFSVFENEKWQKPNCPGNSVNTGSGEDEPNISTDGQFVTYQSWYDTWKLKGGPYYTSILEGSKWSKPVGLGGGIADFFRTEFDKYNRYATDGMTLSPDKKKFIVACGADYDGNLDLYISKKEKQWSYCKKLDISTEGDERSVFIAGDGKTLFFASDSYNGYGGLDIYKTILNKDGTFGKIYNIGKPFNTKDDDYGFIVTAAGLDAYFIREGNIYHADLRKVSKKIKPEPTIIISGKIIDCNSDPTETYIDLYNVDKNKNIMTSKSSIDGYFSFVFLEETANFKIISNPASKLNIDTSFFIEKKGKYLEVIVDITACDDLYLTINFDLDKDIVKNIFFDEIDKFIKKLKLLDNYKLEIIGYTDNKADDDYNMKLGLRRANNVKKYLINNGISKDNIKIATEGEKKPIADNNTEKGAYKNRRVVVLIDK